MNLEALRDWVPLRLFSRANRMHVDWVYLGGQRFTDSFYEQTMSRCLSHPANVLFRHQTPIEVLGQLYEQSPGRKPAGFIFHMSRCGSTLLSQMLAAIPRCRVISEARPVEQVLGANVPEEERLKWFRSMINALNQPRPVEEFFFVKFDAWHVLELPLILRAFPETPWVFIFREPVEVLVSQQKQRGVQVIPSAIGPARFGLNTDEAWFTKLDEYAARVLGRICEAAWTHRGHGRGQLVNFTQMPDAVPELSRDHFHVGLTSDEIGKLRHAAQFDAKRPSLSFQSDSSAKQRAASPELRRLAEEFMQPAYQKLEAARGSTC